MASVHFSKLVQGQSCDLKLGDQFVYHLQNRFEVIDFITDKYCDYLKCDGVKAVCRGLNNNLTIELNTCAVHHAPSRLYWLPREADGRFKADGLEVSFMLTELPAGKVITMDTFSKSRKKAV